MIEALKYYCSKKDARLPSLVDKIMENHPFNKPGSTVAGTEVKGKAFKIGKNRSFFRNPEDIPTGILHGGAEEIPPGTLCFSGEIPKGTRSGPDSLKKGALCASFSLGVYRTRDGSALYTFRYIDLGKYLEIDIVEQPSYEGRNESSHIAHRLPSARGGLKICIREGKEPKTIDKARRVSMEWAELTHTYIKTGKNLDLQIKEKARLNQKETIPMFTDILKWIFN